MTAATGTEVPIHLTATCPIRPVPIRPVPRRRHTVTLGRARTIGASPASCFFPA
jgi:hypothetical protein